MDCGMKVFLFGGRQTEERMMNGVKLVLGASGYVGGRLVPLLLEKGYRVRAAARSREKLQARAFAEHPRAETVSADVLDPNSLDRAMEGVDVVYHLVHSMASAGGDFADKDRRGARNVARAAEAAGLERIIYLGGLGEEGKDLSHHLRSRMETGRELARGEVPVTQLRAAMVIGAGSASFEIMRYLVERLPAMVTPRWVGTRSQPIAISNVLGYLAGCLESQETAGQTLDICGPEVLTYRQLFDIYAEEAGLPKRLIIPVPAFTPKLSSYWIHYVTPVPASLARPLAEGLRNEVVCRDSRILDMVPQDLLTCRQAIRAALKGSGAEGGESSWRDAGAAPPEWLRCGDAPYAGGSVRENSMRAVVEAPAGKVWKVVRRVGGDTGWYHGDGLWAIRGVLDRLVGGVGMRRGRRDRDEIRAGDAVDFWRVLDVEEGRRLLLLAEMRLPGEAVFQLRLEPQGPNRTLLALTLRFFPRGLWGEVYWRMTEPLHPGLLRGMLEKMAEAAGGGLAERPEPFVDGGRTCTMD